MLLACWRLYGRTPVVRGFAFTELELRACMSKVSSLNQATDESGPNMLLSGVYGFGFGLRGGNQAKRKKPSTTHRELPMWRVKLSVEAPNSSR